MKVINEQITKRMKELRLDSGFTQEVIAKKLEIGRTVYNRYEKGQRTVPIEILWQLADIYKVSIDYIIGRED